MAWPHTLTGPSPRSAQYLFAQVAGADIPGRDRIARDDVHPAPEARPLPVERSLALAAEKTAHNPRKAMGTTGTGVSPTMRSIPGRKSSISPS